jgi:large subunit ribosomal protein L5
MNRLKQKYNKEVVPVLMKEFKIKNKLAVPGITKIVVSSGIGKISRNKGARGSFMNELASITGQRPAIQPARISVAGFNIRKKMPIGLKVTLRRDRMWNFFDKLVSIVLPRLRDFRGTLVKSFDSSANYSLGIKEHTVFPEIDLGKVSDVRGLQITVVTNTKDVGKAKRLLELLGMPFEKEE